MGVILLAFPPLTWIPRDSKVYFYMSHEKKQLGVPYFAYWLFNRDPYNAFRIPI